MLRHLLAVAACAACAGSGGAAEVDFRLGDVVVPTRQAIALELDAAQPSYRGSVTIDLRVVAPTDVFHLHSEGQEIEALRLTSAGPGGGVITAEHGPVGDDVLRVRAERVLEPGGYRLEIEFTSAFGTRAVGLYRAATDGVFYSFTQFQTDDAREAFPCWDEPRFKIPYQVTLTVPAAHLAITNTPAESETEHEGWRTTRFAPTPPLPSYLLAVATGPFETVDMPGLGVPGRLITVAGRSHLTTGARQVTPPILKALEDYFGSPYPFAKLDFIAVPEFWPGAMENPGAITYAERLLVMDPAGATLAQRRSQARVIAHELAHQWFGNLVTMEWWDDLWLNESFADWMADKITHRLYPGWAVDLAAVEAGDRIMGQDAMASAVAVRRPIAGAASVMQDLGLAYSKGKRVLAMFERWIGEAAFRRGVLDYLEARPWGHATAADLFAALGAASDKPVASAMAGFLDQPGVPRIEVVPLSGGAFRLAVGRYRGVGVEVADQRWTVPVVLRYARHGRTATRTLVLGDAARTVELGDDVDWLHPNAGAGGYYRWSMPAAELARLAAAGEALEVVEHIDLIGNSAALLMAGEIDGGAFLGVLEAVLRDGDAAVVDAALAQLALVRGAFITDALEPAFDPWVRRALRPALERIGAEPRGGEAETVTLLRPQLLSLLARHGDPQVVADFEARGRALLADPSSVDPAFASTALRTLARTGDAELYGELVKRAEEAPTPSLRGLYLGTLAAFEDPALQRRTLQYALGETVRPNELFQVLGGFFATEAGQDLVFDFLVAEWDRLTAKLPPPFRAMMPNIANGCSAERLARAERFFSRPDKRAAGTERALEQVREAVTGCVDLRRREGAAVAAYLTSGPAADPAMDGPAEAAPGTSG